MTWARGCGESGWISPFGGNAKLPWNLEWAAQWSLFGVTIEPNGKDLATAGGSRDRSDAIAREVFEREPPLNVPYEFLNIGGRKMSTSKGRGAAAHTIAEVVPPEQLRFLFLRHRPNHAIDFDPDGTDQIPRLFDEFDKFAAATAGREVRGELPPGYEATFRYSLIDPDADVAAEAAAFRPAFGHLAMLIQIPGVDVVERVEQEKGSPLTDHERASLDQRAGAARGWLDTYAPESALLTIQRDGVPPSAGELDAAQRRFLASLAERASREEPATGDAWQTLDLHGGDGGRCAGPSSVRGHLSRLPRSCERPAGRVAAGQPGPGVRDGSCSRGGWSGRWSGRMSVGLQRLRDEPDAIRKGAVDKGEDPAIVDRALELDARRRQLLGESEALKAERNAASKRIGEAIKGGASPDGPEVADLKAASVAAGERITALDAELAEVESAARGRAAADPQPGRPGRADRRRGRQRHRPHLGRDPGQGRAGRWRGRCRCSRGRRHVGAQAPLGDRGSARHHRQRPRREDRRLGLPRLQGRRIDAPARPDLVVPRRPHARERVHRGVAARRREHGVRDGHGPDPGQGRPDVRRHPRRAVPGPDGRGAGHQPPPRRDRRGGRACRSATPRTRRASGARRARPARTRAGSCASTSSTRSRWCCSSSPTIHRRPWSG